MTVSTEYGPLADIAEEERTIEHPLLLAALMRRRRGGEGVMDNPALARALLGRR